MIKYFVTKIISGGQTGVDRAAWDVAIKLSIDHGGWSPRGRKAEDGIIPERYNTQETKSSEWNERTELNVKAADGTLIIVKQPLNEDVSPGTFFTKQCADKEKKPVLVVDLSAPKNWYQEVTAWIKQHNIKTLNVAGPRASQEQNIYDETHAFLEKVFLGLQLEKTSTDEVTRPRSFSH
jgi:hypothetical protein